MISFVVKGTERAAGNLQKFQGNLVKMLERDVKKAGYMVQRSAKINVTNVVLRRRSGRLGTSITNVFGPVGGKIATTVGTNVGYGAVHEFGKTITGKNGGYMRFYSRGEWHMVKQVVIPRRPWLSRAADENRDKIYRMFGNSVSLEMRKAGV